MLCIVFDVGLKMWPMFEKNLQEVECMLSFFSLGKQSISGIFSNIEQQTSTTGEQGLGPRNLLLINQLEKSLILSEPQFFSPAE